jgi:hypothetical protein
MRASSGLRIEPSAGHASQYSGLGWLQAGLSSFAYRLAHLQMPRATVVGGLALVFLLI